MAKRGHTFFDDDGDGKENAAAALSDSRPKKRKVDTGRPQREVAPQVEETKENEDRQQTTKRRLSSERLANEAKRQSAEKLLVARKQLPIWSSAREIRACLRDDSLLEKDVLILAGETGSGKSTQVPQFLLQCDWCAGKRIAVTEPRRVAAISLARRVADEMGCPLSGGDYRAAASKVGYSVRFDTVVSHANRIKYLTEGMLLQEMLRDAELAEYAAVIVDEAHERSTNVDILLGFLRRLVVQRRRKGNPLKVVVMSATAETEELIRFFEDGYREPESTGSANGDPEEGDADEASWSGVSSDADAGNEETQMSTTSEKPSEADRVSFFRVKGRQYPVELTYLPAPTLCIVDTALDTIISIHCKEALPGDILVFLSGQEDIEKLEALCNDKAAQLDAQVPKLQILPLFASLPHDVQSRVFVPAPKWTRKVILATNIAETSLTISGVRFVVDSGKAKIRQFRPSLGLDTLLVQPISQASATQRMGRAGREGPGQCHRLYTKEAYEALAKRTVPEILRCDLSAAILNMKARGITDVYSFPLLSNPPRPAFDKATLFLLQLGALTPTGTISKTGTSMSRLPMSPALARVLVAAAAEQDHSVILPIIDLISALSVDNNIFLRPHDDDHADAILEARRGLFRREGDHLMTIATVRGFASEQTDRKDWARRHHVSHRAMQGVMNVRKQLRHLALQNGLLSTRHDSSSQDAAAAAAYDEQLDSFQSSEANERVLKCLISGFRFNTARLVPEGNYRTSVGNQAVMIHPSSLLFGRRPLPEAIVFTEFVYTSKSWARGVSRVQMDWIGEAFAA